MVNSEYKTSDCPYHQAIYTLSKKWVQLLVASSIATGFLALSGSVPSVAVHSITGVLATAVVLLKAYEESTSSYISLTVLSGIALITGVMIATNGAMTAITAHIIVGVIALVAAISLYKRA